MESTLPMFVSEPVTLDGYVPPIGRSETLLGYRYEEVKIGGGFKCMDEPTYEWRHSLTVLGVHIYYPILDNSPRQNVANLANAFIADKQNKTQHPEVWQYFADNAAALSQSNRYWRTIEHMEEIARTEQKIAELTESTRLAKIISQVNITEVLLGRRLTSEERELKLREFGWEYVPASA